MTVKVQGWDISPTHGAIVQLKDGEFDRFWFYTENLGISECHLQGFRMVLPTRKDPLVHRVDRGMWLDSWFNLVLEDQPPDFIGLEDYAYGAKQGAHQIGEVGFIARKAMVQSGCLLRLHDPRSIKLYSAHKGNIPKLIEVVRDRWGKDFSMISTHKKGEQPNLSTAGDLADAFALAKLIWKEKCLKDGIAVLSDLPKEEVQVFTRVTKANPAPLIKRGWIRRPHA